jgi:hypothetical protein
MVLFYIGAIGINRSQIGVLMVGLEAQSPAFLASG